MSWDNNPYYKPEAFDLETIGEVEFSSGSYEFDTAVVWRNSAGELFGAHDSGCSCPTPFDGADLSNMIRFESWSAVNAWLFERLDDAWIPEYDEDRRDRIKGQIGELVMRIRDAR
jgi:hypothetical protein